MDRKKSSGDKKPSRKKSTITIELKKKIIAKFESGARISSLAKELNMPRTTITSILKVKEVIKSTEVAKGVKLSKSKKRSPTFENMEKLLLLWIAERQMVGEVVSDSVICTKAKQLYQDLQRDAPASSAEEEPVEFKASRGWLNNFKTRTGIRSVDRHNQAEDETEQFALDFKHFLENEEFLPQQVFNCDEVGLFWKRMPKRTYITREEKALPGHKPMKDRLTLVLCGNASGDCKIKPLLVYNSENPRVFKKNRVIKSKLSVMWRSNRKALVTRQFFLEWLHEVFVPGAKAYLESVNLPVKVVLVLDGSPSHPPGLEDILAGDYDFVRVRYLPSTVSRLIQPMDQLVVSSFKKLYTRALFQRCLEATSEAELSLRDFWKNHFNILNCLRLIDKAWSEVAQRTMNSAWKILWPECVPEGEWDEVQWQGEIVDEIVELGVSMGLEVDGPDVEELVEEHEIELTTQELLQLHKEQEAMSSDEEEDDISVPDDEIKEWLSTWEKMKTFVDKWHPNVAVVNRHINSFDEDVFGHFRKMLKNRTKQNISDFF